MKQQLTRQDVLSLISADLQNRNGQEIIALVRHIGEWLTCYKWNPATDTFDLTDEAFGRELADMPQGESNTKEYLRTRNRTLPEKYHEFVKVLIRGIVRRRDGQIDYESPELHAAQQWVSDHCQQIAEWIDRLEQSGFRLSSDWAWLDNIYDFLPLFRSPTEYGYYFCTAFWSPNEHRNNELSLQDRDLLAAVGLNPDTDRDRCLDFLYLFAIRMGSFFENNTEDPKRNT